MFNYIKNFIKNFFSSQEEEEEELAPWQTPFPYNGDPEDGDPLMSIMFTLTDKGNLLIELENNTEDFQPIELAGLINYIGSFRGQMDALDVVKEGMSTQEEDHGTFLGHYVSLKNQEVATLEDKDNTPCIQPSEMLP